MNIDIYLTKTEKENLQKIMQKHHVSMSTIADILITTTYIYLQQNGIQKNINKLLEQEYLYKSEWDKHGTIRPKCFKEEGWRNLITKRNMYTTNVIKIYIKKEISKYTNNENNKERTILYYQAINKELMQRKEQFWNYNTFIRSTRRAIRENKDYYKKAIELEERRTAEK